MVTYVFWSAQFVYFDMSFRFRDTPSIIFKSWFTSTPCCNTPKDLVPTVITSSKVTNYTSPPFPYFTIRYFSFKYKESTFRHAEETHCSAIDCSCFCAICEWISCFIATVICHMFDTASNVINSLPQPSFPRIYHPFVSPQYGFAHFAVVTIWCAMRPVLYNILLHVGHLYPMSPLAICMQIRSVCLKGFFDFFRKSILVYNVSITTSSFNSVFYFAPSFCPRQVFQSVIYPPVGLRFPISINIIK